MFRALRPYQVVVDVCVALVFLLIAVPVEMVAGETGTVNVLGAPLAVSAGVAIAMVFTAALAVRRWSPPISLALAWAGAVLQMSLGRPPTAADIAVFGVLYVTAAYGTRRTYWAGFASAVIGAVVITIYLFVGPSFASGGISLRTLPLAVAVLVAAAFALLLAWTVGALVRAALRASANREAQERAEGEAVVEQERVRIARDMHDVVAHSLAVVIAQADGARYALAAGAADRGSTPADPAVATAALTTISTTARAALADVRLLLTQLRHSEGTGPQPMLADLEALYAQVRASGVDLRVTVDPAPAAEPPAGAQLAVYRILQEALTNALRHGAGPVDVRLAWLADRVELQVRNPLPGLPPAAASAASAPAASSASASRAPGEAAPQLQSAARTAAESPIVTAERGSGEAGAAGEPRSAGHGIIGMRERAQLAGGRLSAGADGREFVVAATLPLGGPS